MIDEKPLLDARTVALSAVFATGVAIATILIAFPIGIGYLNFGEIVIFTAAFLFGGLVGGLAGGIGAAAADMILGFAFWAPVTLVVKGLEGLVVGRLSGKGVKSKLVGVAAGAPIMIIGYTLVTAYLEGMPAALFREFPMAVVQAVVGAAIGIPLAEILQKRIPQLKDDQG
ncbi:MAG: ECF transporter S component [Candidatus Thermoplasmatota archaeon]|nr:ECF transporter S component [Candidatus Thermoplasmatota archaeon]